MNRKDNNTASLAVLVFVMAWLALLPLEVAIGQVTQGKETIHPLLIDVDEESVGYVRQAEDLVAGKDYAGAIDILQTLLDRPEQCFVPTENPSRFVSLATRINEIIGQLPPEGMKLYRRLYDIKAGRMFRAAAERFDESALRDIIRRYLHTSSGDDALNLLGAIQFDRGEFSLAARCWDRISSAGEETESAVRPRSPRLRSGRAWQAVLLARIAVAYHLAGESALAAEAMGLLAKRHPQTSATVGGKEQNVAAFTRRMLAKPPSFAGPWLRQDWPCLAGAPDSVAVMGPCPPVLMGSPNAAQRVWSLQPRWTVPGGELKDNPNINFKAAVTASLRRGFNPKTRLSVFMREGRVVLFRQFGKRPQKMAMPALIHPIVVGKTVLYRAANGVVALDLLTGGKLWETTEFPLFSGASGVVRAYSTAFSMTVEDRGLWTVTAGGGKVLAVGKFPLALYYPNLRRIRQHLVDTSILAAFSIANQGRMLWRIGNGEGDSDLIRRGKFMTAPTYVAGRLYVIVDYVEAHHLVCLNAENGRLLWETPVAQMPIRDSRYSWYQNFWQNRASPPAVANGRVFVTSNVGAICAFEAGTGRAIWAYQYDSNINRGWNKRAASRTFFPPNPIIVTGGRAICLPADSERVLALRADTGKLDWSISRRDLRDLAAVDDSRLLLSGEGIRIIDAASGKEVWTAKDVSGVHGRPAVTTDAILASGKGEIIRISLKDFSVTRLPVKQPDAILGNLICTHGKLIAANAAGISAYFPAASTRSNQE